MLSMVPIKSASEARHYFEKDNYYVKGTDQAREASHWWGKGACALSLSGEVELNAFERLLEGTLPDGRQLGRREKGQPVHRPGYDLTFSAPKSVSLLAEMGQDRRIHQAHDQAVKKALAYLEQHAVHVRTTTQKTTRFESAHQLVAALFLHATSRELDPDMHTHCVLLNMVKRNDGCWRSLSSESLFHHKMLGGMIYRSELALNLQEIGYEVKKTHFDGRFEVVGFTSEQLKYFSKRRQDIEAHLKEVGSFSSQAASIAARETRANKEEVDRYDLHRFWTEEAKKQSLRLNEKITGSKSRGSVRKILDQERLITSVKEAVRHLTERSAVIEQRDILRETLALEVGRFGIDEALDAIQSLEKEKVLIAAGMDRWTTPEMLALEEDHLSQLQKGKHSVAPLFETVPSSSLKPHYTEGQKKAIELIAQTRDRIIGIQGRAGTGKTTLLKEVKALADQTNTAVIGLSMKASAAKLLEVETGIKSQTLASFFREKHIHQDHPIVLIVDEASMISTLQMKKLLHAMTTYGDQARLVLVGDEKQLAAMGAGAPFTQFQENGMHTVVMGDILRQKDPVLKGAVEEALVGDIQAAFSKIGRHLHEISDRKERLAQLAADYLAQTPEERKETLVLVPANEDRHQLNAFIREGLKKEGALSSTSLNTSVLISKGLTQTKTLDVHYYDVGDVVRLHHSDESLKLKAHHYYRVERINLTQGMLSLTSDQGEKITLNPKKVAGFCEAETYFEEKRELRIGDQVAWTRIIDKRTPMVTSEEAEVMKLSGEYITLRLPNQKTVRFHTNDRRFQHYDHCYASTIYSSQGKTKDRVLVNMDATQTQLMSQRLFYVAISRARHSATLYLNAVADCAKVLESRTGMQWNALTEVSKVRENDAVHAHHPVTSVTTDHTVEKQTSSYENTLSWDLEQMKRCFVPQLRELTEAVLGPPNKVLSTSQTLRYGKKGSLVIALNGEKAGVWFHHETGEKGDFLSLVQHQRGGSFKETLDYLGAQLGLRKTDGRRIPRAPLKKNNALHLPSEPSLEDQKAMRYARHLQSTSCPIQGTLAETYLRVHRGIKTTSLPDSLRFHPGIKEPTTGQRYPALLVIAQNETGITQAVQAIFLDPGTANKANVSCQKRTFGRMKWGAHVTLNTGDQTLLVAEGPETALSLKEAFPGHPIQATLSISNFKHIRPKQKVLLCLDHDGDNATTKKAIEMTMTQLREKGIHVDCVQPDAVGQDFNDVLQEKGVSYIQQQINTTLSDVTCSSPSFVKEKNEKELDYFAMSS